MFDLLVLIPLRNDTLGLIKCVSHSFTILWFTDNQQAYACWYGLPWLLMEYLWENNGVGDKIKKKWKKRNWWKKRKNMEMAFLKMEFLNFYNGNFQCLQVIITQNNMHWNRWKSATTRPAATTPTTTRWWATPAYDPWWMTFYWMNI